MGAEAIHDVTRGLRMLLYSQLTLENDTAIVTLLPPGDALPNALGVNLYLYRVVESPSTKNVSWQGSAMKPLLGLNLSYLLTPLGKVPEDTSSDRGDDAHTMLGVAMMTLHENPVLNDVHIPGFDADSVLGPALLDAYDQVKVSLLPTSIEELSKIWATINQPYRLSVAYEVNLVELIPDQPAPVNGALVARTALDVFAFEAPTIDALEPATGALARLGPNDAVVPNEIVIRGSGLSAPARPPSAALGGAALTILEASANRIRAALPTNVNAGPDADVRVTVAGRTGPASTFRIGPWLASLSLARSDLHATPTLLTLTGQGFSVPPFAVLFESGGRAVSGQTFGGGSTASSATVEIPALANGVYAVRLIGADDASSATNARTLEIVPLITPPVIVEQVKAGSALVDRIIVNGARLDGVAIALIVDGVAYLAGPNANPNQIVYTFGRTLAAGAHTLAVEVDGFRSLQVEFVR